MYLVVFQNGEFISEIHFWPYCRNLKILGLIEISNIPKAVLRWYYTKEMSFFKIRQNSIILYLSDVEIIVDFSSENRFQKYHFFIELRLFTYTDYLEYLKRNYATRMFHNCAVNSFFFFLTTGNSIRLIYYRFCLHSFSRKMLVFHTLRRIIQQRFNSFP